MSLSSHENIVASKTNYVKEIHQEKAENLNERRKYNRPYTLQPHQYLSDLNLTFERGVAWLIANTGDGKTQQALKYAENHPKEQVLLVVPTLAILYQTAEDLRERGAKCFCVFGKEQFCYDVAGITLTTYASFASKCDINAYYYDVTVFLDEAHLLTSDASRDFRGKEIAAIYDLLLEANKAILMTATPYFLHSQGLQAARKIYVKREEYKPDDVYVMRHSSEFQAIKILVEQSENLCVFEINSKRTLADVKEFLETCGVSGVYSMSSDETEPGTVFDHIVMYDCLPKDCKVLLTTKLFETGLNIYGATVDVLGIFPQKPFEKNMLPESVPTPHDIKQCLNRFRDTTPIKVFLMLPDTMEKKGIAYFNGDKQFEKYHRRGIEDARDYNEEIALSTFQTPGFYLEEYLRNENASPIRFDKQENGFCLNLAGVDHLVFSQYKEKLRWCLPFYFEQFQTAGIRYAGEIHIAEYAQDTSLSEEDIAILHAIKKGRKKAEDEMLVFEIARLQDLDDLALVRDRSPLAPMFAFLKSVFGTQAAGQLLYALQGNGKAFGLFKKQLYTLKALKHEVKIPIAHKIYNTFAEKEAYTGKDAINKLLPLLNADRKLCRILTKLPRMAQKGYSEKKAIANLRLFFDVSTSRKAGVWYYKIKSKTPVFDQYLRATEMTLENNIAFQRWLKINEYFVKSQNSKITKQHLEMPVAVAEADDTLKDNFFKENLLQCVTISETLDTFARQQLMIFGKVF
jgi:hypothetical protein